MKRLVPPLILVLPGLCLAAPPPQCASWPANMAIVQLKNAGIIEPAQIDESRTKAVLLATEKVGKDLYRQVYDISLRARDGRVIEVITSSEASSRECSMSDVDVYVIARKIGGKQGRPPFVGP